MSYNVRAGLLVLERLEFNGLDVHGDEVETVQAATEKKVSRVMQEKKFEKKS